MLLFDSFLNKLSLNLTLNLVIGLVNLTLNLVIGLVIELGYD
jgi:hypothetical protein